VTNPTKKANIKQKVGVTKTAPVQTTTATLSANDKAELLRQLKLHLQAVREKLMLIKPDELKDAEHVKWTEQIYKVSLAINGLRNKALKDLSDQFETDLADIQRSTAKLTDDLDGLQKSVAVIKAVSGALGVIGKVIGLLG